jgi:hypothetical protein
MQNAKILPGISEKKGRQDKQDLQDEPPARPLPPCLSSILFIIHPVSFFFREYRIETARLFEAWQKCRLTAGFGAVFASRHPPRTLRWPELGVFLV